MIGFMSTRKFSFIGKKGQQTYEVVPNEVVVRLRRGASTHDLPAEAQACLVDRMKGNLVRLRTEADSQKWLAATCVEAVFPVLKEPSSGLRVVATDELTVRFKPSVSETAHHRVLQREGLEIVKQNRFVPNQLAVRLKGGHVPGMVFAVAARLNQMDEIEFATPAFLAELEKGSSG
jgi:hypothetical protein